MPLTPAFEARSKRMGRFTQKRKVASWNPVLRARRARRVRFALPAGIPVLLDVEIAAGDVVNAADVGLGEDTSLEGGGDGTVPGGVVWAPALVAGAVEGRVSRKTLPRVVSYTVAVPASVRGVGWRLRSGGDRVHNWDRWCRS